MPTLTVVEHAVFDAGGSYSDVDSHTYGWKVIDYTSLRRRTRVGEDRPIPGSPGRLFVAREWDEHQAVLTWRINGRYDKDGTPYSDSVEGVDSNHQFILDNLVNVLGLIDVAFTDRHDVEWDGSVVVDNWEPAPDPNSGGDVLLAPLTLVIPAGMLTEAGS